MSSSLKQPALQLQDAASTETKAEHHHDDGRKNPSENGRQTFNPSDQVQ
ncbi:MAG: hypothetical protein H6618_08400 [Deltaproteobacteria bacterium]|nr:hypothetical protein [Deltaproteobacteria bacterium]